MMPIKASDYGLYESSTAQILYVILELNQFLGMLNVSLVGLIRTYCHSLGFLDNGFYGFMPLYYKGAQLQIIIDFKSLQEWIICVKQ